MTEQNMEQTLRDIMAARATELVQASLFPHEVEELAESGLNEVESPEDMSEEQQALVQRIYENHMVLVSDEEAIGNLHLMTIDREVYALHNAEDIVRFNDALQRAREEFDAQVAEGTNTEDRSSLLDLTIGDAGPITDDYAEKVKESGFMMLGLVVLPAKVGELALH